MRRDHDRRASTQFGLAAALRPSRSRLAIVTGAAAGAVLLMSLVLGSVTASTPVTVGYRDFGYGGALASRATSDPEQSKLWYNDGAWWGGLFVSSGTGSGGSHFDIFKFNPGTHSWVDTTRQIDIRDLSHADYLWDGAHNKLYVASSKSICTAVPAPPTPGCNDGVRVYRYSYNSGAATLALKYTLDAGFPKVLVGGLYTGGNFTGGGTNGLTIAKDSTGEVWVAYTRDDPTCAAPPCASFHSNVYVAHSVTDADPTTFTDELTWTVPAKFGGAADGQTSQDNTAAIVAFGSPATKIGLYWTDKHAVGASSAFFAVHNDGDDPATWSSNETVTSLTNGAENQVNLKADSTGKVYAIIKTALSDQIKLFDRSAAGTWSGGHAVWTSGNGNTRAQVVIDEELGLAYALSASGSPAAGTIYVKAAPLSTLSFPIGKGSAFIASATDTSIDDVTVAKHPVTAAMGLIAEASDHVSFEFLHGEMTLAATDTTPPTNDSVTINGGAAFSTRNVTLTIPATDAGSGVSLVRVANDPSTSGGVLNDASAVSSGWAPTMPWTLPTGDGPKTVYAQFQDGAGNWSSVVSDDITLDTTGPTGNVSINGGASFTNTAAVTLDVTATDAGVGISNVRLANVGDTTAGVLTDPSAQTFTYSASVPWTLAAGADGSRTVYVQWQDLLGNWSGVDNDLIFLDTTPPAAGTVTIDEGTNTGSPDIHLTLTNPDGVARIRIAESPAGLASATPQAYAASTPYSLLAGLDGTRTVYVAWEDDAGNLSTAGSDSIVLDLRDPVGTVAINGGSVGIHSLNVILSFPNSDTDIDKITISNSPTMVPGTPVTVTAPFNGTLPWMLAGPLTNGLTKSVYVTFHDLAGHTSAIVAGSYSATDNAKVDLTKPVMHSPVNVGYVAGTSMTGNYVPLRAIWPLASDTGTGVGSYRVWVSKDGHAFVYVGAPTTRTFTILAASGHAYRFRVYAVDRAGNASASVYSATTRVAAYQESSRSVRYSGSWGLSRSLLYYGGAARVNSHRGAATALTFTGRSIAWLSLLAPTRGSANVYVDGHLISTVNLYSLSTSARRVVFSRTWSTSGTHTIKVVVLGTAGHPRVDLDAFIVLR